MTVRGNRGEAERELAAMVASVRSGRAVAVRSPVSELLEAWFAVASTGWAPTTTRQTRSVLDRYLHRQLGGLAVGEVTPAIIDAVYADLRRQGGVGGRPLASGTLARVHTVLRAAFGQAMRWGWIWDNPAERAHRIVATTGEHRPPTPDEVRTLLEYLRGRDEQLHLLVMLAAVTGARRAQLLGLRWHNVQLDNRRVSFCAGWVEGPDGPVLTATKTRRKPSWTSTPPPVPCSPATRSIAAGARTGSCSATMAASPHGSRTGSPRRSSAAAGPLASAPSVCMTCATSW
jgi:integrase